MCGIVGAYPHGEAELVAGGLDLLAHRGPDARHLVRAPHGTVGHARLSILDVEGGSQPMADHPYWIVYNGEVYNFKTLQHRLPGALETNSDTEVILKLYLKYGPEAVKELDGMYAFAILAPDHLFLARDALGIKPLYWARQGDTIFFASEIKALLPVTANIEEFPAGCAWHSQKGFMRFNTFDDLALVKPAVRQPEAEDYRRIRTQLAEAVEKRMIADPGIPVGISLSGGLDSSIITALARQGREQLDTFGVGAPGSEDLAAAKRMSQVLDTRHHSLEYTFPEMLAALPEVIYYLESFDAPLVRSAIPNYFLARLASDHVKVMLSGEGADELFAGYEYLRPVQDPHQLQRELWTIMTSLHNTNLQRTDRMTMAHGIEGRVPFLDLALVELAFSLPPAWKISSQPGTEKALLRKAFAGDLPEWLLRRPKKKFSQGAGSAEMMAEHANQTISDAEYDRARAKHSSVGLRSKEELLYYRIFQEQFGSAISPEVIGRTRSVTAQELN
jgi:asparagine synthase (glutamine-hydrolysing)